MAVVVLDDGSSLAKSLSQRFDLALTENPVGYFLRFNEGRWEIGDPRQGAGFRLQINLGQTFLDMKRKKINPKKDLLCRAIGFKGEKDFRVLDGTLGMAKDALHLLSCGAQVIGFERNPLVYFLLMQSLKIDGEGLSGLNLQEGDCQASFKQLASQVNALYLDPMFENVKQKSAPKKGLAFLREVSNDGLGVQRVIELAIQHGIKRVVVKRPHRGDHLNGKPQFVFEGKLIRYDVYTR